ncbi:MAG: hypothetical protein AAGA75_00590 [Cyanobacteria bacterium P01_E01_bin.6]
MVAIVLTPEKAFHVIQELQHQRKRISGRLVWQHCGEIGSISTAVKWVKISKAIAQGDESIDQELVDLWEAIARGDDITDSKPTPVELPSQLQELFVWFSQKVAIAIQEAIAEGIIDAQKTAACEIEAAEEESIKAQDQARVLEQELQQQQALIEQHGQTIAELKDLTITLHTRQDQLAQQLKQSEREKAEVEAKNQELSQRVGMLSEKANQLVTTLDEKQTETQNLLRQLTEANETNRADKTKIRELEQSNAICQARLKDIQNALDCEHQNRRLSEKRCDELSKLLTQTTGEAAAAVERAKHFEARISELKTELKQKE